METSNPAFPPGSFGAQLAPAAAADLLTLGGLRQYADGARLTHEGEQTAAEVTFILDGYVKITATTLQGGSALLAIRSCGDLVGEIAVIDSGPRTATATAAGAVLGRTIDAGAFAAFLSRHSETAMQLNRVVAEKLRSAIRRRLEFVDGPVRHRLARVLLDLVTRWPRDTEAGLAIAVALNQAELAALVGVDERSVHKALAELRKTGVIKTGYRRIVVSDLSALRALSSDQPGALPQ